MLSDCRKGERGLCQVKVLSVPGLVDHRDVFISDKQEQHAEHMRKGAGPSRPAPPLC